MSEDDTKALLRSCLLSSKNGLSLRDLESDYDMLVGGRIPFRKFGFSSLEEYLRSIPDVVDLRGSGAGAFAHCVVDSSTARLASLIQRQKSSKKRPTVSRMVRRPASILHRAPAPSASAARMYAPRSRVRNARPVVAPAAIVNTPSRKPAPPSQPPHISITTTTAATNAGNNGTTTRKVTTSTPLAQTPSNSTRRSSGGVVAMTTGGGGACGRGGAAAATAAVVKSTPVSPIAVPSGGGGDQALVPVADRVRVEFESLRCELGLPQPDVVIGPANQGKFYARIKMGDISCHTYPTESVSKPMAEQLAFSMLLQQLQQLRLKNNSADTQDDVGVVSKIEQIIGPAGLWSWNVTEKYTQHYPGEFLPSHWKSLVRSSPSMRIQKIDDDKFIIYRVIANSPDLKSSICLSERPLSGSPPAVDSGDGRQNGEDCVINSLPLPADLCFPVYVTCVLADCVAFVIIGDEYNERLEELMTEMEIFVMEGLAQPALSITVGHFYMALVDGVPHRVQVFDVLCDAAEALFVDIGDTEQLAVSTLYRLSARFCQLPTQAVHATLSHVDCEQAGARQTIGQMLLKKSLMCQMVSVNDVRLEVVLFDTSSDVDININNVLKEELSASVAPALPQEGGFQDVFVMHVAADTGSVFVQPDTAVVADVMARVAACGATSHPLPSLANSTNSHSSEDQCSPLVLIKCAHSDSSGGLNGGASDGGIWARARVLSRASARRVSGSGGGIVSVLLVDYGRETHVPACSLHALNDPDLQQRPGQCVAVQLWGVRLDESPAGGGGDAAGRFSPCVAQRLRELLPCGRDGRVVLRVVRRGSDGGADTSVSAVPAQVELFTRSHDQGVLVAVNTTLSLLVETRRRSLARQRDVGPCSSPVSPAATASSTASTTVPPATAAAVVSPTRPPPQQQTEVKLEPCTITAGADGFVDVVVAYSSSPWNIYLQPYSESGRLRSLITDMQLHYNQTQQLDKQQQQQTVFSAKHVVANRLYAVRHHDNVWYRGRVLNLLSSGEATVHFVDFGDFSHVSLLTAGVCAVQPLCEQFIRHLPAQAIKARLVGVAPLGESWTAEDCVFVRRLLGERVLVAHVCGRGVDAISGEPQLNVQLIDTTGRQDIYIHEQVAAAGHAKLV